MRLPARCMLVSTLALLTMWSAPARADCEDRCYAFMQVSALDRIFAEREQATLVTGESKSPRGLVVRIALREGAGGNKLPVEGSLGVRVNGKRVISLDSPSVRAGQAVELRGSALPRGVSTVEVVFESKSAPSHFNVEFSGLLFGGKATPVAESSVNGAWLQLNARAGTGPAVYKAGKFYRSVIDHPKDCTCR